MAAQEVRDKINHDPRRPAARRRAADHREVRPGRHAGRLPWPSRPPARCARSPSSPTRRCGARSRPSPASARCAGRRPRRARSTSGSIRASSRALRPHRGRGRRRAAVAEHPAPGRQRRAGLRELTAAHLRPRRRARGVRQHPDRRLAQRLPRPRARRRRASRTARPRSRSPATIDGKPAVVAAAPQAVRHQHHRGGRRVKERLGEIAPAAARRLQASTWCATSRSSSWPRSARSRSTCARRVPRRRWSSALPQELPRRRSSPPSPSPARIIATFAADVGDGLHAEHHHPARADPGGRHRDRRRHRGAGEHLPAHGREEACSPREAAIEGTRESAWPSWPPRLSLVVVFLPVAFMAGIVGRFMNSFGLTMAFAIAVSLFVSLHPDADDGARAGCASEDLGQRDDLASSRLLRRPSSAATCACSTGRWPTAG